MIATITFLPTDERQTSRSQAPRVGALPRSAGIVAGALTRAILNARLGAPYSGGLGGALAAWDGSAQQRVAQRAAHLLRP